jgi:hypothetical protein
MMHVTYTISKFYMKHPSLCVSFLVKKIPSTVASPILLLLVHSNILYYLTMVFGQGEHLPHKKRTAPRRKRSVDRTKSRKRQKKEGDTAEDNAEDGKEDTAEDNEVYNEEDDEEDDEEADEDDEDDKEDDDEDEDDEERPLTMEEKQLRGMDYVSQ